jgi:hypothetical protein
MKRPSTPQGKPWPPNPSAVSLLRYYSRALSGVMQRSISLERELASEPLHLPSAISVDLVSPMWSDRALSRSTVDVLVPQTNRLVCENQPVSPPSSVPQTNRLVCENQPV